jgi:[ribosomal protein S18]-alanine N-acetyltransferase
MQPADIPRAMEIAAGLPEAPRWPWNAYTRALDPEAIPARIAMVADDPAGGVAGFIVAALIPPQGELETIAVIRTAQRRGLGAALLAELFATLKNRHITEVMLEVRESNGAAREFYAAAGFQETGRRPAYYADPKEDAVLLARRIP